MRRRSAITDAELNRVLRVAKKHGVSAVEVKLDGAEIKLVLVEGVNNQTVKLVKKEPIRLG